MLLNAGNQGITLGTEGVVSVGFWLVFKSPVHAIWECQGYLDSNGGG